MKRHFYTIGSLIILLIAAFVFVLLPAMVSGARGAKLPPFGKYNGKYIKYEQGSDFANAVAQYGDMLKNQGKQIDNSSYFYIFNYAFNSTVTKMAYTDAVNKSGWKVPDRAIDRTMLPYFTDADGKYSPKLFKQASEESKTSLQNEIKSSLLASRYYEDNFGSYDSVGKDKLFGLKVSSKEIPFLQGIGTKQRTFDLVAFDMSKYPETESAAYGTAHPELFVKYDASVISCSDESEAKKVLGRLNKKEITFKDAVSEYSKKSYSGDDGKLNNDYGYQLKMIISDEKALAAVKNLKKGEISSIIKTSIGYSIFQSDGDPVQPDFTGSAMIQTVYGYLKSNEMGHIEDYYTNIAKDFSSAAAQTNFDDACKKLNIVKTAVPAFPLNYGSVSVAGSIPSGVKELSGAATDENFLKTAFSLKQDEISEPLVLGQNVLVLKMTGETAGGTDYATALETFPAEIKGYDQSAAQAALFASPKLVNNVAEVFFKNFLKNE